MITDMAAFLGHYERRQISANSETLARALNPWGVTRIFAARIDHLRMDNCHAGDRPQKPEVYAGTEVITVPVVDPTIATWRGHVEAHRVANNGRLPILRLHPNYHGYKLTELTAVKDVVQWAHDHGTVIQVAINIDDIRRQHALGQVPDVPVAEIAQLAQSFPHQPILISGAVLGSLRSLKGNQPKNLWADTARIEGGLAMPILIDEGWGERLVFASHAPILIAHSAVARVVVDLSDEQAMKILSQNAQTLLSLNN